MKRTRSEAARVAAVTLGVLSGCASPARTPPPPVAHAPATATSATPHREGAPTTPPPAWSVVYREPASLFEMVDNASGWWPDKNDAAYRKAWAERFGISSEDEAALARFSAIRKRTYSYERPASTGSEDLLGREKPADTLAFAFYGADTLEQALAALPSTIGPEDRAALSDTFQSLRKRLGPWLSESRGLDRAAAGLGRGLDAPAVREQTAALTRFFGVERSTPLTFVFVRGPSSDHVSAHARGPYVVLEAKPTLDSEEASREVSVPFHELGHHLVAQVPVARRHAFSTTFRAGCSLPARLAESGARAVEEPLMVAIQRVFEQRTSPEKVDFSRPWYGGDPWVGTFAKLLYGLVSTTWDSGGGLDEALARRSARLCDGLLGAAKELTR